METIQGLMTLLLILVPVGAGIRIALCFNYASLEEDSGPYKKKARNALIFAVLAELVVGIIDLVVSYFGGGVAF